jgi:hypothetical protein
MSWSTWVIAHRRWGRSHGLHLRHIRQLDRVAETVLGRVWAAGAGPGQAPMTIELDSTIYEVHGHHKGGAAYGYTRQLGYHPLLATRADTGEMLHIRMRKGSANSARGPSGSSTSWLAGYGGPARLGSLPCGPARASGPPRS